MTDKTIPLEADKSSTVRPEFLNAIITYQASFGLAIDVQTIGRLADYYELLMEHNPLLHLVAPCSAEEFATRHILESLTLLRYLPKKARFADIGPGGGLPSIPCLIARPDLTAVLVESSEKKAGFLQTVLAKCELQAQAEVIARQFSEIKRPDVSYVTCRALDKFTQKLPQIIKWSGNCTMLLYGGGSLRDELRANGVTFEEELMPLSAQRYLIRMS